MPLWPVLYSLTRGACHKFHASLRCADAWCQQAAGAHRCSTCSTVVTARKLPTGAASQSAGAHANQAPCCDTENRCRLPPCVQTDRGDMKRAGTVLTRDDTWVYMREDWLRVRARRRRCYRLILCERVHSPRRGISVVVVLQPCGSAPALSRQATGVFSPESSGC